jgi:hypothetical protein
MDGHVSHSPVWAKDTRRNLELASERPPWLARELCRLAVASTQPAASATATAIVDLVLLGPNGIAIPVCPLGLEQPPIVIPIAGLAPGHGLLRPHYRQPPLHPRRRQATGRRRQRQRRPRTDHVVELGGLVGVLAAGAGAAVLDGVGEAVGADLEVALAGEDVVAALVAHDLGVAAVDGAGGALGAGHLRVAGLRLDHLVHEVRPRDAVEAAGEERVGDVLLLHARRDGRVHRLVVRRRRDRHVVVEELLPRLRRHVAAVAELAVEVVAGVAHVAPRVGAAGERHHRPVAAAAGGLSAAVLAGVGHAREAAAVAVTQAAAAAGSHGSIASLSDHAMRPLESIKLEEE